MNKHEGLQSLKFVNASPLAGGVFGGFTQNVAVQPGTLYHFSAWVKASGVPSGTANSFVYRSDWSARTYLAGGTYEWTQVTWDYTTGTETTLPLFLVSQDTGTLWVDEFSMVKDGTSQNLLVNAGFETSAPGITITTKDLAFQTGNVVINVDSSAPSVGWVVTDTNNETVSSGTLNTSSSAQSITLNTLPAGYYGLRLTAGATVRNTSFAVITNANTLLPSASNRFGTTSHPLLIQGVDPSGMMGKMGLGNSRIDLRWDLIETAPGVYTWDPALDQLVSNFNAKGVKPLVVMAYYNQFYDGGITPSSPAGIAGFANFAAAAAQHFGTTVEYEVYNEYNYGYSNGSCGQTADCYLQLLQPTYSAIKSAVPTAKVVAGAVAGLTSWWLDTNGASYTWVKRLLDLGGLSYMDALSIHSYGFPSAPEGQNDAVITRVRNLMNTYTGGSSKPLWLDETGYHTAAVGGVDVATQADYLARDAVMSIAAGAQEYMFYDLFDDWPDPNNGEARFGVLHNTSEQSGNLAPKRAYVSLAVASRQLSGYTFVAKESLGTGVFSYKFQSGSTTKRVMWATTPATVGITSTGSVTVVEQMGVSTTYSPEGGTVPLQLTGKAVFVTGSGITGVTATTASPYGVTFPAAVWQNQTIPLTVSVDNRGNSGASTSPVTFRAPNGTSVVVASTPNVLTTGTLNYPAYKVVGNKNMSVDVRRNNQLRSRILGATSAIENPKGVLIPQTAVGATSSQDAVLKVVYLQHTPTTVSTVDWSIGTMSGSLSPNTPVDANGEAYIAIPATGLPLWKPHAYSITFTMSDGVAKTINGSTSFAPVRANGTPNPPAANLATSGTWVDLGGGTSGAADQSGTMWVSHSGTGLTVHAVMTDDVQSAAATPDTLWQGDSIQFGVTPSLPGYGGAGVRFGAALLTAGPVVYRYSGTPGLEASAVTTITRNEIAKTTTYSVYLPYANLGIGATDSYLSYSFLANDNDGSGRAGFTEWGSGIGVGEDAGKYLPLQKL